MAYETLLYDVTGGLARITVNRPDKLNALNDTVISELGMVAERVAADTTVHAVILTGAGPRAFVAGADISDLTSQGPMDGKARARAGQMVFRSFERLNKPVIAAVNGFALGGGCELAMACHVRIASDTAKFGQPEVKLGLLPGYGGTVRLPRIVGKGRALELLLTGALIDAAEALRIGLVSRVVPADKLLTEAEAFARAVMEQGPLAVRSVLEAVDAGYEMSQDDALLLEANLFGLLSSTDDMREGTRAFLEKRKPAFEGR
jgi:enoyl-CoA hydratase